MSGRRTGTDQGADVGQTLTTGWTSDRRRPRDGCWLEADQGVYTITRMDTNLGQDSGQGIGDD